MSQDTVMDILLDTGSSRSLVRRELVSDETLLHRESVAIHCAHGDTACVLPCGRGAGR